MVEAEPDAAENSPPADGYLAYASLVVGFLGAEVVVVPNAEVVADPKRLL